MWHHPTSGVGRTWHDAVQHWPRAVGPRSCRSVDAGGSQLRAAYDIKPRNFPHVVASRLPLRPQTDALAGKCGKRVDVTFHTGWHSVAIRARAGGCPVVITSEKSPSTATSYSILIPISCMVLPPAIRSRARDSVNSADGHPMQRANARHNPCCSAGAAARPQRGATSALSC
jgi:hypothetical protein